MIGQDILLREIDKIESVYDLSKSIIIEGKLGSGKHSLVNLLSSKFNVECHLIDYELNLDILNNFYILQNPLFCVVDMDKLSETKRIERFQNTILKFIEEPPENVWIFILVNDKSILLNTILNRSQIFTLKKYSIEELRQISSLYNKDFDDYILNILETPGMIYEYSYEEIKYLIDLCDNIFYNITKATPSNVLSISNKFKKDSDIYLFINVMIHYLYNKYINSINDIERNKLFLFYRESLLLYNKLNILCVNKTLLLNNYFLNIKDI